MARHQRRKVYTIALHVPSGLTIDQSPHVQQCTAAVATTSAAKAAELLGVSEYHFAKYGQHGGAPFIEEVARANHEHPVYAALDCRPGDPFVLRDGTPATTMGEAVAALREKRAPVNKDRDYYTVVVASDETFGIWSVVSILKGAVQPLNKDDLGKTVHHITVAPDDSVEDTADDLAAKLDY